MNAKGFFKFVIGVGLVRFIVKEIAETIKWKAYYEADDNKPLPPGYFTKKYEDGGLKESAKVSTMPKTEAAIADLINNTFDTVKREIGPSEGQKEASGRYPYNEGWGEKELRESIEKARKAGIPESQIQIIYDDCDACHTDISAPETSDKDEEGDNE